MTHRCTHCGHASRDYSGAVRHLIRRHRSKWPFLCDRPGCRFVAFSGAALADHKEYHIPVPGRQPPAPRPCPHCAFVAPRRSHLHRHLRSMHRDRLPFRCASCPFAALTEDEFRGHIECLPAPAPDAPPAGPVSCATCGSQHANALALARHRRAAHSPPSLGCPSCPAQFRTSLALREHARNAHDDATPFGCSDCALRFPSQLALRTHVRIVHRGGRGTHSCPHCDRVFVDRTHLVRHACAAAVPL